MLCDYETMSDINALLWRKVKDGKQYIGLIPDSNCSQKNVGIGMTDLSVREMAAMVRLSLIDTAKIAPLFSKSSLKETCAAIYGFVYDHFQYKADTATQYLRSPSCSWKVRYDGIDCKSYSIIASSILTNLGLIHYIRQIRQPGFVPEMWTHVYIVVPIDQKTGSLSKGHYTIDGTVATMNEPLYIQKSDLKMSMQHIALRGAQPQPGLGISLSTVKSMFGSGWAPSCIGGVHDATDVDKTLATIVPWFDDAIYSINDGIRNNDPKVFDLVNRLLKNTQQIQAHSKAYAGHDWNSKCSKDATAAYRNLGQWYYNIVMTAFVQWLEQYFDVTYTTLANVQQGQFEPDCAFTKTSFAGIITVKQLATLKMKPTTVHIPEINQGLMGGLNAQAIYQQMDYHRLLTRNEKLEVENENLKEKIATMKEEALENKYSDAKAQGGKETINALLGALPDVLSAVGNMRGGAAIASGLAAPVEPEASPVKQNLIDGIRNTSDTVSGYMLLVLNGINTIPGFGPELEKLLINHKLLQENEPN